MNKWILTSCLWTVSAASCGATPGFVQHVATAPVFGEPAGVTMREPDTPREGEAPAVWIKIGASFSYDRVCVYYTTDASAPSGAFGAPGAPSTHVLRSSASEVTFVRNQPSGGTIDWWKATLPAFPFGTQVRYSVSAWSSSGGPEIFANNTGCADGVCDDPAAPASIATYTVKLAWPGQGAPHANPDEGYPAASFWKEEAVTGNNWMNVQIDQNGAIYDVYYPSAGCVHGMGTRNEGYADGPDTFPPFTSGRGQMNLNIGMLGLRANGVTYWMSNEQGAGYSQVSQSYVPDTNVIHTTQTLTSVPGGIHVDQYDFCVKGAPYPATLDGLPNPAVYLKRVLLTNTSASSQTLDVYYYADYALNGSDSYDAMFWDSARGAMGAYDNTYRMTSSSGEYNPTFFGSYEKDVSVCIGAALKLCASAGASAGTPATDAWRDSSPDNGQGWIGLRATLSPGETREIDLALIGAFRDHASATPSPYDRDIAPALGWFFSTSAASLQQQTEDYWRAWLAAGTTIQTPDPAYDALFKRSLLATALHYDEKGGGIVAGMHNGAYPFVWPRDAVYAAITLDRTGHFTEGADVYRFLRETAFRAEEEPGRKGWWFQKYTTDGYQVWTAPQVDETAAVPWGVKFHYDATGDTAFLNTNYQMVYEAARSSSEDSLLSSQIYFDDANKLMHSNNVWEDSYDDFLYSNAACERGLKDAAAIASYTGHASDAALFTARSGLIHQGLEARLAWDGENTDISQLGLAYPFAVFPADDARLSHVVDRIKGAATDRWGGNHPLLNANGEFTGLINRYWGDGYWGGGPWFLSTLWYGQYYAKLQDSVAGKAHIDVLKDKLDLLRGRLGPAGLGAEQIAPSTSLLYPSQGDFSLQAAWPNAWESMSTLVDALMLFLDFTPDARQNRAILRPKLPTAWSTMTFKNIRVGPGAFNVTCSQTGNESRQVFTNVTASPVNFDTVLRVPEGRAVLAVLKNGVDYPYTALTGGVQLSGPLNSGAGSVTTLQVIFCDGCVSSSIQQIKSAATGARVYLPDVVVTRAHAGRFNIETRGRSAGLAVMGTGVLRGLSIRVIGTVGMDGPERVLNSIAIVPGTASGDPPGPLLMTTAALGGEANGAQAGVTGAFGLNNVGLDVTVSGRISALDPEGAWMALDDGAGSTGAAGSAGVRLTGALEAERFSVGDFVSATGSVSVEESAGRIYPLLRIAQPGDILRQGQEPL